MADQTNQGADPRSASGSTRDNPFAEVAAAVLGTDPLEEEDVRSVSSIGREDPLPGHELDGAPPGDWKPDELGLPPGCPVLPLGTEEGVYHFLDTIGQMRSLRESEFGQGPLNSLFLGRHYWLYWAFPRKNSDGLVTSWRPEKVREILMGACARKGSWSAANRVRGRGTWRGRKGQLILHCGDRLLVQHGTGLKEEPLGELEGMIYPTRPPIETPWPEPMAGKKGPALQLLPHLQCWNWSRPRLDPILLIGWIASARLGGALGWRPECFIQGDKGSGKSSIHADLKGLFGSGLVQTGDTTAAGIYQELKFDCLPVAIDEFEAKNDTRKQKAVIELARLSCSGAPMHRGGDNHRGTKFFGRSSYLFSMINTPPMDPQDLSRSALLRLKPHKEGAVRPVIPEHELVELGRQMQRRLIDNWHRWDATFTAWREFLADCGHDGRGQDTFGTLMAAADLVIDHDAEALGLEIGPNAENFNAWRDDLEVSRLAEYDDASANWRLCLSHIMSQRIEAWRGGTRHTVGEVLTDFFEGDISDPEALKYETARKLLEQTGLTLLKPTKECPNFELLVPNQHPLLHQLFQGSKWAGELAAGVWSGALRMAPDEIWRDASARIHGEKKRGTAFALKDIIVTDEEARS
ncbi:DNA primase [Nitratireductor indicus C115]|uniref:DNA primase n=1 Tax=Nitratireductor indicus C115 TaxID=1231190 RepID=K2PQI4_9HYPH|nr:hypothetical protein [Nitratireductor indicus]EKF43317.1 DNA primase [Nitratireductor indicus C115]SFQ10204.1 hypothetical protein SAMN05216176_101350 [Nitratireductor indicus]